MMEDFWNEENRRRMRNDITDLTEEENKNNNETYEKIYKNAFEKGIDTYCGLLNT